jgi:hypothetical protein
METPQWVKDLEAKPCECVPCAECKGTGNVFFSSGGRHYLGSSRRDDMDEMETCDECRYGVVEECERCTQLRDWDDDSMFM